MASNPPGACCFTGFKHEGTPAGEFKSIGKVHTYFAYPKNKTPDKAVILLGDIFGIFVNSQLLADDFAANGYLAVLPDLFEGDQVDIGDFEAGKVDIGAWVSRHGTKVIDAIIDSVINHLRDVLGIKKIAGAGYCFGGKYVVRFLKEGKLDTGYSGHPSFVSDDELATIEKPFSISAAEIDDILTAELRHKSESILGKTGQNWQINLFSGVTHGFTIRSDLSVPHNKFSKEQAFLQALACDTLLRHARGHGFSRNVQRREKMASGQSRDGLDPESHSINVSTTSFPAPVELPEPMETTNDVSTENNTAGLTAFEHVQTTQEIIPEPPQSPSSDHDVVRLPAEPLVQLELSTSQDIDSSGSQDSQDPGLAIFANPNPASAMMENPYNGGFQGHTLDFPIPTWFASADLELNTLQPSTLLPSDNWLHGILDPLNFEQQDHQHLALTTTSCRKEDMIRKQWFTFIESSDAGYATPDNGAEETHVDERYREKLYQKLRSRVPDEPLPSAEFLNLCIQMYFTRFNHIFPIVHAPTFRPSTKSSLLTLSICSLGSLFIGSPGAATQGRRIFERLNKAVLASWETFISRGKSETLAMIQTSLIGQTFGMLSGRPRDLLLVQTFHGTVITWARRDGMFQRKKPEAKLSTLLDHDPDKAWKEWVQREEQSRAAAAIYIHDAEFSALFSTEPFIRTSVDQLFTCSDELWAAQNAQEWKRILNNTTKATNIQHSGFLGSPSSMSDSDAVTPEGFQHSQFNAYLKLESIASSILQAKAAGTWLQISRQFESALLQFHMRHLKPKSSVTADSFCQEILWHAAFISLFADLNRLELAAGKDGYEEAQKHLDYARTWATSQDGRRCALHGALILQKAENMSIGAEPAIHVPRVLYWAAIIWYGYTEFGRGYTRMDVVSKDTFPELERSGVDSEKLLFQAHGFKNLRPPCFGSRTLRGLVDLLQRIGHWDLSRKLASLMMSLSSMGIEEGASRI
ncbi:hypothetical protein NM208_g3901 [Fusarium decemcellulare]|uniref:Uncharacterized protein n=1 Tax=Fusarium decemcellulare TaxID=57161 RepID=A0ACC1SMM1_9HYPO|nr:hypothetical protein NM208_g3901 [Fusarium decemcellulare]